MPRGAPKGNQNAAKDPSEKNGGATVSLYLDARSLEFLQAACKLEGKEPTASNAKKRAKKLAKDAIDRDMLRTFRDPRLPEILGIDLDTSPE